MLHWYLNDNTCVLTTIETNIRKHINGADDIDENECFTCQLINPVYDFRSNYDDYSTIIYILTILLWSISVCKLIHKYCSGEITSVLDLFIIK